MLNVPTAAAIVAISLWIVSGTLSKKLSKNLGSIPASAIIVGVGIIPMLVAFFLLGRPPAPITDLIIAAVSGIFLSMGFVLIYKSLRTEQLTNAVALAEIQPAILVLFGIFVLGEHIGAVQLLSIIVIFLGAWLVITTERLKINKRLIPALLSPVSWGMYWILMSYAISGAGTYAAPVLVSRLTGTVFMIAYVMADRRQALTQLNSYKTTGVGRKVLYLALMLVIVAALVDATGDTLFSYVVSANQITIGGALSALSPMFVSLLGLLLYKEKLNAMQSIGIVIMVAGAFTLSVL